MAEFNEERLRWIVTHYKGWRPRLAVETGVLFGQTTALLAKYFDHVYAVELSGDLITEARRRYPHLKNIHYWQGDSADVVPKLTTAIDEACLWFLDAHWYPRAGVVGKGKFPLWAELDAIAKRPQRDIVVVDDVHSFGKDGDAPEAEWQRVTFESVGERLDPKRVHAAIRRHDQFIVWRR